jgi:hypothetical protein
MWHGVVNIKACVNVRIATYIITAWKFSILVMTGSL